MLNSVWLAILTLIVTILSTAAGILETVKPNYALIVAGLSGALSAFLRAIQSTPAK